MIYVSATNRKLTEKYVDWAVQGLPGAIKLNPTDIIKKTDCKKTVILVSYVAHILFIIGQNKIRLMFITLIGLTGAKHGTIHIMLKL